MKKKMIMRNKGRLKIIYSCYWGSYLAVVAASLHLGRIDGDNFNKREILNLGMFDKIKNEQLGHLFYFGTDELQREVYVTGSKKCSNILNKTLRGIAKIYGMPKDSIYLVDLNKFYNLPLILGIFIKKIGLKHIGLKLVLAGIEKSYKSLQSTVESVKNIKQNPVIPEITEVDK